MNAYEPSLVDEILQLLPQSPFADLLAQLEAAELPGLAWLNWLVPIPELLQLLSLWLVAIVTYYAYSVIARWIKLIGD